MESRALEHVLQSSDKPVSAVHLCPICDLFDFADMGKATITEDIWMILVSLAVVLCRNMELWCS